MKVVAIVRAKNETNNIGRFIECYLNAGVDEIVVSDAGSEDDTVAIAKSYEKVKVLHYDGRVKQENNIWRSPNGAHWNFIIDHAIVYGADWMIHDDADCVPTKHLQQALIPTLHKITEQGIKVAMAYRMYMWGFDQYFPRLSMHGQGLYAFTKDSGVRFVEGHPSNTELVDDLVLKNTYKFEKPEALLHYFCPDEETVQKKMKFYRDSGEIPEYQHPLDSCGKPEPIEDWMKY